MDIRLAGKIDCIETPEKIKLEYDTLIIFVTGYEDIDLPKRAEKLESQGF